MNEIHERVAVVTVMLCHACKFYIGLMNVGNSFNNYMTLRTNGALLHRFENDSGGRTR